MESKKKLTLIFFLLALVMVSIHGQTKIAVLSDIHVMSPDLVVNDGSAWQNAIDGERKLLDYSAEIYDYLIEKYLEEKPDMLLITGDLTKDGELASHRYVLEGLEKLRKAGIAIYVIPGNHDLGTSNAYVFDGDDRRKAEVIDATTFEEMYHYYGYDSMSKRESTTLTYACEPLDGLLLIGIDSGNGGFLSDITLDWVCQQATQARASGKQVIAMMHHSLFPHVTGMEHLLGSYHVKDHENVRNRLADAGVRVLLTGHVHFSDIAKDYNANLTDSIYDVNTGSPISYPCDYREMTLSQDLSQLTINTGHITTLPSNADFKNTAKSKLQEFTRRYASSMFGNELFGVILTSMIVIHAEGNENSSTNAKSLLSLYKTGSSILKSNSSLTTKLASRGMTWDDVEVTLNSMLKDLSHYGEEEREDQTDDLNLTINLPDVSSIGNLRGDIDKNGLVNIADVIALVDILFDEYATFDRETADIDGNGIVNVTDVICLINIILGNSSD